MLGYCQLIIIQHGFCLYLFKVDLIAGKAIDGGVTSFGFLVDCILWGGVDMRQSAS